MRQTITDQDAKEAGVKKELYQDWIDVMQALWEASITFYVLMGRDKKYFPKQVNNEILIGPYHRIDCIMVNSSYVESRLWKAETQLAEILYEGDVNPICQCFGIILKSSINGK